MAITDAMGTVLYRNGSPVNNVRSISAIGPGRALRDVTVLSDANHKHKKNIPDFPEIAIEVYYDPDDLVHQRIMADDIEGTTVPWQIYLEEGNSPAEIVEFSSCYVVNSELQGIEVDGDIMLSFSLKPQAAPIGLWDGVV